MKEMRQLDPIPGWVEKVLEHRSHFTPAGLSGLLDHHSVTNALGEALAIGGVTPTELLEWVEAKVVSRMSVGPSPEALLLDPWAAYNTDSRAFWEQCWEEILDRPIDVPPVPKLKNKTQRAIERYQLMLIFLPAITQLEYPKSFKKPDWKQLDARMIQFRPLSGRWVLVEKIGKPNWYNAQGYYIGDLLTKDLDSPQLTRFGISWDRLTTHVIPSAAKLFSLGSRSVRLSTVEEWNLINNLFQWLKFHRKMDLPRLDSTASWEWCFNAYGFGSRLLTGYTHEWDLTAIREAPPNISDGAFTFRLLAVL